MAWRSTRGYRGSRAARGYVVKACILRASDLSRASFMNVVQKLGSCDANTFRRRVWVEAADGWAFDWWQGMDGQLHWCSAGREPILHDASNCLARSTAGRLFSPDGELRWRVIPALGATCFRTVFLGEGDWSGDALRDCSEHLEGLQSKQIRLYLWGQQTAAAEDEWIQLRIPHRFRYPVTSGSRYLLAVVEQWYDEVGEPHFMRICDLQP